MRYIFTEDSHSFLIVAGLVSIFVGTTIHFYGWFSLFIDKPRHIADWSMIFVGAYVALAIPVILSLVGEPG